MQSMFVLAVRNLAGDEDKRVAALAAALGLPEYDAHLRAQGPAPRVVATYGAKAKAARAAEVLHAAGLDPIVLGKDQIESDAQRVLPRSFTLGSSDVRVRLRDGRTLQVDATAVTLLKRNPVAKIAEK
jgi:predicted house-cleaning NTP pyrophosphatase (Maf/HAM1 superfamily)